MLTNFLILKKNENRYTTLNNKNYYPFFYLYDEYLLIEYAYDYIEGKVEKGEKGAMSFNSFAIIILPTGKLRIEYLYDDFEGADFYRFEISLNLLKKIVDTLSHFDHKKYSKIIMTLDDEKELFTIEGFEKLSPAEENDPLWETEFQHPKISK